jgi:hypothetical protein
VTCGYAKLRAAPSDGADIVAEGSVDEAALVKVDTARSVTSQAGAFETRVATTIRGRMFGGIRHLPSSDLASVRSTLGTLPVQKGDIVEYLQSGAPGRCFIRVRRIVVDADTCPLDEAAFQLVREPLVEKWARVTLGDHTGWLKIDEECVRAVKLPR